MTQRIVIWITGCIALMLSCTSMASASTWQYGSFATDLPSSAPTNLSPANAATLAYPTDALRFSWDAVAGTSKYQISIARQDSATADCALSTAFSAGKIIVTKTVDEAIWVPTLTAGDGDQLLTGTYCWRVRGKATAGYGAWSDGKRFTRSWSASPANLRFFNDEDGPMPRANEAAASSASTRLSGYLYWDEVAGAAKYEVEIYNSYSLTPDSLLLTATATSNRIMLPRLPDDAYYWRIRALDASDVSGSWTNALANTFTVAWTASSWASAGNISPVDAATSSDMTLGWSPMQGASSYRLQVAAKPNCLGVSSVKKWGDWVSIPPLSTVDLGTGITTYYPYPPTLSYCSITDNDFTTINNYATSGDVVSGTLFSKLWTDCSTDPLQDEAGWKCVPAPVFHSGCAGTYAGSGSWPADLSGATSIDLATGVTKTYQQIFDSLYDCDSGGSGVNIYWRVRPEYSFSQSDEDSWVVNGTVALRGRWVEHENTPKGAGAVTPLKFGYDPATAATTYAGTRCESPDNLNTNLTLDGCLVYDMAPLDSDRPTRMAVNDMSDDSSTHQFPLMTWQPFPNAGGYEIQIARDSNFNNVVYTTYTHDTQWIPRGTLPDTDVIQGYWYRITPCTLETTSLECLPVYYAASSGTYLDNNDGTGAQYLNKSSTLELQVTDDFSGTTPLIQAYQPGAATDAAKAAGLPSTSYYEFELSTSPRFTSPTVLKSTVPRVVPMIGSGSSRQSLANGVWHVRARSVCKACNFVDQSNVTSGWSDTEVFTQELGAPTLVSAASQTGVDITAEWASVTGASSYQLQISQDPTFTDGITSLTTRQSAALIDAPSPGTWYWRVRANVGTLVGEWSDVDERGPYATIDSRSSIMFDASAAVVQAGSVAYFDGQLLVHGFGRNDETLVLQRKSTICNASTGTWSTVDTAITGGDGEEGTVRIGVNIDRNRCFRWKWDSGSGFVYSAPIDVKSYPRATMLTAVDSVRRGGNFGVTFKSGSPLTGRVRFQYKFGSTWYTFKTASLNAAKTYTFKGQINRAGNLPLRAKLDQLVTSDGDQAFVETNVTGPTLRVNDLWSVYS